MRALLDASSEMPVFQASKQITDLLSPLYGAGEAKAMTRIIFENIKGWSPVDVAVKSNEHLTPFSLGQINDVLSQLLSYKPIQYVFGTAWFYGMKLKVTPDTLIPRPETAELVDLIVQENQRKDLRVIDLCTGSGCIAVALARNLPFSTVVATDISDAALAVARENAKALHADVRFISSDLLTAQGRAAAAGSYDIIVSNPPYIVDSEKKDMSPNVLEFEPHGALFVPDADPILFYKAIFAFAGTSLAQGGKIYLEINPMFSERLLAEASKDGFVDASVLRDTYGRNRFLIASK